VISEKEKAMDEYNPNGNNFQYEAPAPKESKNDMATASMVMGILSLCLICCCPAQLFGALGIIFAILSRTGETLHPRAKAGLICSIIGIVLSAVLIAGLFIFAGSTGNGTLRNLFRYWNFR
jgi:hypothetical protein